MKLFRFAFVMCACVASNIGSVLADNGYCNNANYEGEFCALTRRWNCPAGCYCTGKGGYTSSIAGKVENWCLNGTNDYGGTWGGATKCPQVYPKSDAKSTSETQCYMLCSNSIKIFNRDYTCPPGYYFPTNSVNPTQCPDDGVSICPGIATGIRLKCDDEPQGIKECGGGKTPNADRTKCEEKQCSEGYELKGNECVKKPICIPGEYLPGGSENCAPCPAGSYCTGGQIDPRSIDQYIFSCGDNEVSKAQQSSCITCESGTAPNEDHSACVGADNIEVKGGYYLPANSIEPRPCKGTKKYCPGGYYGKGTTDRGIFDCPYGSDANKNKTGCVMDLTKDQMKYGIYGREGDTTSQCWIKTDPEDYKTCIYGTRTKEVSE